MAKKTADTSAKAGAKTTLLKRRSRQIGAFCYRTGKRGEIEFLLVTSSEGRWILPKGWPMPGTTPRKVARIEAWEEAGVRKGKASRKPVMKVKSHKQIGPNTRLKTRLAIYAIKVKSLAKAFPEDDRRDRRWVTLEKAERLISDKRLRKALQDLTAEVTQTPPGRAV